MAAAVVVVRDLLFATKITGTAQVLNVSTRSVADADTLRSELGNGDTRLVIVDMALPEGEAENAIRAAAESQPKPTIVAFYSHVETALRDAAQAAGADLVVPRSRFAADLPALLEKCR